MFERLLRRWLPLKELGWEEIGEKFTRFILFKSRRLSVYLHKLDAPIPHPQCHDHPWDFFVLVLKGGYWETLRGRDCWRGPGSVLWRPADTLHGTTTKFGRPNWSIVVVSERKRAWGFRECVA